MPGPFIWNGVYSLSLQSQLNINNNYYVLEGTVDPTVTAQNAPQGSIYFRTGSSGGAAYLKQDNGSSTNWAKLSTSSTTLKAPTVQKFISSSGTYTTPTSPSPLYIRTRLVGGGGGGGGAGTGGGNGGNGGNTTFGTSLLVGNGGNGGNGPASAEGGPGGTASLGSGPLGFSIAGSYGGASGDDSATQSGGGSGGASPFGGNGGGGVNEGGYAAITNSGSGGGGGSSGTIGGGGGGGGSGGYVDAIITSPSSTYSYAIGAAGSAGSAGTAGSTGGAGGSGFIIVEEFYQ